MMAFLILAYSISGRFGFGSRHGLRPSAPRAAYLALIAFRYWDFLHSAGNESPVSIRAQFSSIYIGDFSSQFHTATPHIPLISEWSSPERSLHRFGSEAFSS